MEGSNTRRYLPRVLPLGLVMWAAVGMTGCQVDIGGQTMPSPYYMSDDIQYFPPGPEFKLAREAAALKQQSQEEALRRR